MKFYISWIICCIVIILCGFIFGGCVGITIGSRQVGTGMYIIEDTSVLCLPCLSANYDEKDFIVGIGYHPEHNLRFIFWDVDY